MLTDQTLRAVKRTEKGTKRFDEKGLYLIVSGAGAGWWRLKYRFQGREKLISLGTYPEVSLARAREKRDEARKLVSDGIDPSVQRQAERAAQSDSFEAIAGEWLKLHEKKLAAETLEILRTRFERLVYPFIGKTPIGTITAAQLLTVLRRIEARGRHETAHRVRSAVGRVLRYAVATGRAERDVTGDLKGALAPAVTKNFASITDPLRVGELLRAIDGYVGQPGVHAALKLAPHVFVRPGELRAAEWSEFDLDAGEWRIPAERMKMGEAHLVPLSRQAIEILGELEPLTGSGRYLFPGLRTPSRPISENTINAALRRLGYSKDEMTGHGFRSMASTLLNEQGFPPDVIELQLAHVERNKVRGAYNRAQRLTERRRMMQAWSDYLDGLKAGGKVVPIGRRHA